MRFCMINGVKIYGSRAKGNYRRGSDIDLAFSRAVNESAKLFGTLDALPLPYLFDMTHYESLKNQALKEYIDRVCGGGTKAGNKGFAV